MKKSVEATGKNVEEALDTALVLAGVELDADVEVEVLDSGNKGFFGIGGKNAKVRVTFSLPEPPVKEPAPVKPAQVAEKQTERKPAQAAEKQTERKQAQVAPPVKIAERKPIQAAEKQTERKQAQAAAISPNQAAEQAQDFLKGIFAKLKVDPVCEVGEEDGALRLSFSGNDLGILIGRHGETLNALQYLTNLAINQKAAETPRIVLDVENYRKGREQALTALAKRMADKAVHTGRKVELEPMNPYERRIVHMTLQEDARVETQSQGAEPYRQVIIYKKHSQGKRH
ncbi:MAG: Jag N-terminal domain-containing protein [Clostridiales bacterium]|nr:Jag N-terminal domain-containing protein [Clostridiales bacterium]